MMCRISILIVLLAGYPACGNGQDIVSRSPAEVVTGAFATPYGKTIIAEFGAILRESADDNCLRSKGLDAAELPRRAEGVLLRHGAVYFGEIRKLIDQEALERIFAAKAGATAKDEMLRLNNDPEVKKLNDISEPGRTAGVVNQVAENIGRVALLVRIKLVRSPAPIASGRQELLEADPTEKSVEAQDDFAAKSQSAAVKRYLALGEKLAESIAEAPDRDRAIRLGPLQLMPDLQEDLIGLCIPVGR
jgi:hypothetical protein